MSEAENGKQAPARNLPQEARSLIAHARNDITIPYFTDVLSPIDDTLIARGQGKGLKIYDEVERDAHAYAVLQKRKFALIGRDWALEPASESAADQAASEFVKSQIKRLNFDQICLDLLDATLKGFSIAEILWAREGAAIIPQKIVAHDPRRFVFDANWRPRLLTMDAPMYGLELPERKFIVHRFGVKGNNPYGLGLGSKLFWPVLFKREGIAFWMIFLEKYASPTPVGKYPLGMLPQDQQKLLNTLLEMRQTGAIVAPLGSDVSFLETARAGNVSYEQWCRYWDEQMALCVFGSTLATHVEGQGSRAASETHKEAEEQIIDADADLLSDTLRETLFRWLIDYNFPGAQSPAVRRPRPKNEVAHEDLRAKRAKNARDELQALFDLFARTGASGFTPAATALASAGLMPNVSPEALTALAAHLSANQPISTTQPKARQREGEPPQEFSAHDNDTVAAHADQCEVLAAPALEAWLRAIRGELSQAVDADESFQDFSDRLLRLDPKLSIDPMGRVLASAIENIELEGRADVREEISKKKARR